MKVTLWLYRCDIDGTEFEAAAAPTDPSTLMLRSTGLGTPAVTDAGDEVFAELSALAAEALGPPRSEFEGGARARRLLSVAADPDRDGSPFVVGGMPPCPTCGTTSVSLVRSLDPPKFADEPIGPLRYTRWQAMSHDERVAAIRAMPSAR